MSFDDYMSVTPEQVVMIDIQKSMRQLKKRSFSSYLKYIECNKIQRTSLSVKEISSLLNISTCQADLLAVQWHNTIGGQIVSHADLYCYYFKGVYDIIN